jgi:hypothetical protein
MQKPQYKRPVVSEVRGYDTAISAQQYQQIAWSPVAAEKEIGLAASQSKPRGSNDFNNQAPIGRTASAAKPFLDPSTCTPKTNYSVQDPSKTKIRLFVLCKNTNL